MKKLLALSLIIIHLFGCAHSINTENRVASEIRTNELLPVKFEWEGAYYYDIRENGVLLECVEWNSNYLPFK